MISASIIKLILDGTMGPILDKLSIDKPPMAKAQLCQKDHSLCSFVSPLRWAKTNSSRRSETPSLLKMEVK